MNRKCYEIFRFTPSSKELRKFGKCPRPCYLGKVKDGELGTLYKYRMKLTEEEALEMLKVLQPIIVIAECSI